MQVPFGATVPVVAGATMQAFADRTNCVGSTPASAMPVTVRSAVPVFVIWIILATLDVLTTWSPNASAVGFTDAAGAVPVPVSETESAVPTVGVRTRVAPRAPAAAGVKVTVMLHVVVVEAQPLLATAKSAGLVPVNDGTIPMPPPMTESVTVCGVEVVLTSWFPKASVPEAGETSATAATLPSCATLDQTDCALNVWSAAAVPPGEAVIAGLCRTFSDRTR